MILGWLLGCAPEAPPPVAPAPLAPLVFAQCPPVPDDVVAAVAPDVPASPHQIADRVARAGPDARCPWSETEGGRGAVLLRGDAARVALVRRWSDGPTEVLLTRPVPMDAERRIAASVGWTSAGAALTWWDDVAAPCTEEVALDPPAVTGWSCPNRPAPPIDAAVPWPDPVER